jgi:plastocyanin
MKTLHFVIAVILGFSILFVTNQAYAPCIEGPGINCNNYPPPALTQINADKLNYETTDKPAITIIGVPQTLAHLEVDDSYSNIIFTHDINLSSNGTGMYILDISSYKPGVYSAIATSSISKITTSFSIGIISSGGVPIVLNTDKNSYMPGGSITILGTCLPNTLVQLSLLDPNGVAVNSVPIFSDKTGYFSSSNFTIPTNAIAGIWQIDATRGISHARVQITINSTSNNSVQNMTNSTSIPPNAIRTQNGGWITPFTQTDNGTKLHIHYEVGTPVSGTVPPPVPNSITQYMLSPLYQFKSGVSTNDIVCKEGLYLAIKSHNLEPTCLKAGTISKLASRGFLYGINANETTNTTILIPPGSENPSSNKTYSPDVATVVLGVNNTVTWVNQAKTAHSFAPDMPLQQDGKSFGSDMLRPGGSYQFIFAEPGIFAYHGEPHPWQRGTIIVLPYESSNFTPFASKTYNLKQVHYYDSLNLNPKVSLYDYSYGGIDKDGLISIDNQTFYQTTLDNDIYKLKGVSMQFHNVTFSFPEGTLTTPGGAFVNLDVKFQDGFEEIYGGTMPSPDGSSIMVGGISIPTQYGPHLATKSITVLGNHTMPQAGLTIYNDKIKLLVSIDNQASSVLKLSLITNSKAIRYGESIWMEISVSNTLPIPFMALTENDWKFNASSLNVCSSSPVGISILSGYYTEENMTEGKQLSLYNNNVNCPYVLYEVTGYQFEPSSNKIMSCSDNAHNSCDAHEMRYQVSFSGYWSDNLHPFDIGTYTVIGADEWGHVAIEHFVVTNPESISITPENSQTLSINKNNGIVSGTRIIEINMNNFHQSRSPMVVQVFYPNDTLCRIDKIPSTSIQPDGFYKYNFTMSSADANAVYGNHRIIVTYNNQTVETIAGIAVPP